VEGGWGEAMERRSEEVEAGGKPACFVGRGIGAMMPLLLVHCCCWDSCACEVWVHWTRGERRSKGGIGCPVRGRRRDLVAREATIKSPFVFPLCPNHPHKHRHNLDKTYSVVNPVWHWPWPVSAVRETPGQGSIIILLNGWISVVCGAADFGQWCTPQPLQKRRRQQYKEKRRCVGVAGGGGGKGQGSCFPHPFCSRPFALLRLLTPV